MSGGVFGTSGGALLFSLLLGLIAYILIVMARAVVCLRAARRIDQMDGMTGQEFEAAIAALLKRRGYKKVTQTPETRDSGIDVIGVLEGETVGFQCKRYAKNVGNHAVMEAYAGIQKYELDRAVVVTNAYFTSAAADLAERTEVELWDRDVLIELIKRKR